MMLSQWRTNMTKIWYSFLQDGDVNDCQGHRCKICVQSHVCPACSLGLPLLMFTLTVREYRRHCRTLIIIEQKALLYLQKVGIKFRTEIFHKTILQKHFSHSRKRQSGNRKVWDTKQHIAR